MLREEEHLIVVGLLFAQNGVVGAVVDEGVGGADNDGAVAGFVVEVDVGVPFGVVYEVVAADVAVR